MIENKSNDILIDIYFLWYWYWYWYLL